MGETNGKARHRSPSYPAIALDYAVEMAGKFYEHAKRTTVSADNVASYWGFSTSSSGWRLALAALKQYGLLESVGGKKSGKVKLTERALKILLDTRQNSPDRIHELREAAASPAIYREIWEHWEGKVPDDSTFQTYLTLHKGFNESAVAGFIADFKKTVAFANLTDSDIISPADEKPKETSWMDMAMPKTADKNDPKPTGAPLGPSSVVPQTSQPNTRDLPVTLPSLDIAVLRVRVPMSVADYDALMNALAGMKKSLVKENGG